MSKYILKGEFSKFLKKNYNGGRIYDEETYNKRLKQELLEMELETIRKIDNKITQLLKQQ